MKTKKLLKRMGAMLEGAEKHKEAQCSSLKKLLKRLEEKEAVLAERLLGEKDTDKAAKLKSKINLLKVQRKKGEQTLSELG